MRKTTLAVFLAALYFCGQTHARGAVRSLSTVVAYAAPAQADAFIWPEYNPTFEYDFRDEYPDLDMPTRDLDDCPGVVGTRSSGWWTFKWGADKNPVVTQNAITPMLERLNEDFAYFRDTMGWPPDRRVQDGYRSAVYLYGSGLCTDNASNTDLGGWQSSVGGYPIILASYYPVYSFDPACTYNDRESQMGAMVHEGIHCVLASLPGCKQAAWFHEGGNTWLQQQADAQRSGNFSSMGFLNGAALIAPFMPIECYSGWLQDGSFGGPSAEGVNMHEDGKQICTWRRFLGGTQYGNLFPTFLGEWVGPGTIPWIWKHCPERVLEGIAESIGGDQVRRLITEYRAKLALLDMRQWSGACKRLLDNNFRSAIGAEWEPYWIDCEEWIATPYAKTTNDGNGLLTPEQRTTPGWSGANLIPLTVEGDRVSVDFQPIGENMSCQLCYRAEDGTPIYGRPVEQGNCSLRLDKRPANDVVIAVICNTDYIYEGEQTRTAHHDYRLQLGEGAVGAADIYTKWYDVDLSKSSEDHAVALRSETQKSKKKGLTVLSTGDGALVLGYNMRSAGHTSVDIYTPDGARIKSIATGHKSVGTHTQRINLAPYGLSTGTYFIKLSTPTGSYMRKTSLIR